MKMKKLVSEGESMPRGYGFSYWDWDTFRAVCHPIPFNILEAWRRKIVGWLMATYPLSLASKPPDGYTLGYYAGIRAGKDVAGYWRGFEEGAQSKILDLLKPHTAFCETPEQRSEAAYGKSPLADVVNNLKEPKCTHEGYAPYWDGDKLKCSKCKQIINPSDFGSLLSKKGQPWTEDEDRQLMNEFWGGIQDFRILARKHGRSTGAMRSRASRLGLTEAR